MYASIWGFVAVFIGLCTIINGSAIPHARGDTLSSHPGAHTKLERRVLPANKKPARPPPQPAKPPTSPVGKPGKPGKPPPPPSAPVDPVKYPYEPRLTKAIDVCDFPAFQCFEEDESTPVKFAITAKPAKPGKSVKRAPPAPAPAAAAAPPTPYRGGPGDSREYNVNLRPSALVLRSKPYWTSTDLYNDKVTGLKLKKRYVTFKTKDMTNKAYEVHVVNTQPDDVSFATEHILELQTVKKFIESVTQTEDEDNPKLIKLRQSVDGQCIQAQAVSPKDESINDIVFEALGSKTNVHDLILCQQAINSAKGRLWSNQNPANPDELKKSFKLAAAGALDTATPMSVILTVLGVYEYMKLKEVDGKLQNEVANIKIELGKDKLTHILGANNLPIDKSNKTPVDLSQMWDEYMVRHVLRFKRKGADWLLDQLIPALAAYQKEKKALEDAAEVIKKENKEDAQTKKTTNANRRKTKMQSMERGARALKRDMNRAKLALEEEDKKLQAIKAQVDGLPLAQRMAKRKALGFFQQVAKKTKAAKAYFDLRIGVGRADREAIGFDEKRLPEAIMQCTEDMAQINTFLTLVKKMDTDVKMGEATLELGGISVGDRPKSPTNP